MQGSVGKYPNENERLSLYDERRRKWREVRRQVRYMADTKGAMGMCSIGKKLRTLIVGEIADGTEIGAETWTENGGEKMDAGVHMRYSGESCRLIEICDHDAQVSLF
jgi:hypothetical protein